MPSLYLSVSPPPRPTQPSGKGPRLPEVYCVISRLGCFGLFSKVRGLWLASLPFPQLTAPTGVSVASSDEKTTCVRERAGASKRMRERVQGALGLLPVPKPGSPSGQLASPQLLCQMVCQCHSPPWAMGRARGLGDRNPLPPWGSQVPRDPTLKWCFLCPTRGCEARTS